jgi:hypothetical protein
VKAVFVKPNKTQSNLKDFLTIKTRSLGAGRGTRAYVSLLEGFDCLGKGHRDFESTMDAWDWIDAMRLELVELGWSERLPKRCHRARR